MAVEPPMNLMNEWSCRRRNGIRWSIVNERSENYNVGESKVCGQKPPMNGMNERNAANESWSVRRRMKNEGRGTMPPMRNNVRVWSWMLTVCCMVVLFRFVCSFILFVCLFLVLVVVCIVRLFCLYVCCCTCRCCLFCCTVINPEIKERFISVEELRLATSHSLTFTSLL